jgi:5-methylcytosine-specific restriction endonuclease McrA
MTRAHKLMIAVAESDSECRLQRVRGQRAWIGRCIHCRRRLVVPLDPREPASATLEHIVPRTHGGSDALDNLALACPSCNHEKGRRLDHRALNDPTLQAVIARLLARRRATLRGEGGGA